MSATTHSPEIPTISSVVNAIMGAVYGWMLCGQVQWNLGQSLIFRAERVRDMWRRFEAGTLRRRVRREVVAEPDAEPEPEPEPDAEAVAAAVVDASVEEKPEALKIAPLPFKHGWLLTLMGWQAGHHTNKLRELLEQPGFGAFLEEFPNVARTLRPVCRAFGVDTELLRLPRKEPVPKPLKPRVRKCSYVDIEYRNGPDADGQHWVLRKNARGIRFKRVSKSGR